MKIVINTNYGGFSLSKDIYNFLGLDEDTEIERDNLELIKAIETLGIEKSNGYDSKLKIIEIPDDVDWIIEEYDGKEWISEVHRIWE